MKTLTFLASITALIFFLAACTEKVLNPRVNTWTCTKIEEGMNSQQVFEILGKPSTRKEMENPVLGEVEYLGYTSGRYVIDLYLYEDRVYKRDCIYNQLYNFE